METTLVKPVANGQETYKHLGFNSMETAEIVSQLNKLLASYAVHYHKLRAFHWNVEGRDFFELHEKFEENYNQAKENIDDIAERVRIFGQMPLSTMKEMLKHSEIEEPELPMRADAMVKNLVDDLRHLLSLMVDISDAAAKSGDLGTLNMMNQMIQELETRHWMYSVWLKDK